MIYKFRISFSKGQQKSGFHFFLRFQVKNGSRNRWFASCQAIESTVLGQVEELPILILLADISFLPNEPAPLTPKLSFLGMHSRQPTTLPKMNIIISTFLFGSTMLLWEEGSFMRIIPLYKTGCHLKALHWVMAFPFWVCFWGTWLLVFNTYIQLSSKISNPKSISSSSSCFLEVPGSSTQWWASCIELGSPISEQKYVNCINKNNI